jgi:hypothetical protein
MKRITKLAAVGVAGFLTAGAGLALHGLHGADAEAGHGVPVPPLAQAALLLPVTRHRGLPASLDEVPRTAEYAQGVEKLRTSYRLTASDMEGLLDYHLHFRNRLETCYGPLPSTGSITYQIVFRNLRGWTAEMGPYAAEVLVDDDKGLSDADVVRLAECGKVAFGLPLAVTQLPGGPEFHLFVFVPFPLTLDSYPYRVLRTGQGR